MAEKNASITGSAAAAAAPKVIIDNNKIDENSSLGCKFFFEDEVFCVDKKNKRVKFGIVLSTYENNSDSEGDGDDQKIKEGDVRVVWHPSGDEEILQDKTVGLVDRTLMPGDVVKRLRSGKDAQKGYCRELKVYSDLRIRGNKYVIKNVSSERLRQLSSSLRDSVVCLNSWVGNASTVNEKITLKSSCGEILELYPDDTFPINFIDMDSRTPSGPLSTGTFYVGQTLLGTVDDSNNVKWKSAVRSPRTPKIFKVTAIETEGINVRWQWKAGTCLEVNNSLDTDFENNDNNNSNNKQDLPKPYITGEDLKKLKRLNLFESCMLQINDKTYLKINENDEIVPYTQWRREQNSKYRLKDDKNGNYNQPRMKKNEKRKLDSKNYEYPEDIIKMKEDYIKKHNIGDIEEFKKWDLIMKCLDEFTPVSDKRDKNGNVKYGDPNNNNNNGIDTDEDDAFEDNIDNGDDDDDDADDSETADSSSGSARSHLKRSPLLSKKGILQKKRLKNRTGNFYHQKPIIGEEYVTEALLVRSLATVVWQDGAIEFEVPSTELYPIHFLDSNEFFPGDFVQADESKNLSCHDYGVVQKVDHLGRTAVVKWGRAYTSSEPSTDFLGETEVSVYDLKDHPDFQYHPGTVVILVSNLVGDKAKYGTIGQVIDNYPDGRVHVWWVSGDSTMCWPHELFGVRDNDIDNEVPFWMPPESDDDDSWETESEISDPGKTPYICTQLSSNLKRARIAMSRLEEIFRVYPCLENEEIMRKLIEVYKKCRFMDRLMNTSFFHENNFMGLIEKVRQGVNSSTVGRAQESNALNDKQQSTAFQLPTNLPSSSSNTIISSNNIVQDQQQPQPQPQHQQLHQHQQQQKHDSKTIQQLSSSGISHRQLRRSRSVPGSGFEVARLPVTERAISPSRQHRLPIVVEKLNDNKELNITTSGSGNIKINNNSIIDENTGMQLSSSNSTDFIPNKILINVISKIDKISKETRHMDRLKYSKTETNGFDERNNSSCASNGSENDCFGASSIFTTTTTATTTTTNTTTAKTTSSNSLNTDNNIITNKRRSTDEKTDKGENVKNKIVKNESEYLCAKLCTLIKAQLIAALLEISERFCQTNETGSMPDTENTPSSDDKENCVIKNGDSVNSEEINSLTRNENETKNVNSTVNTPSTSIPSEIPLEHFMILESAPVSHAFYSTPFAPSKPQQMQRAVQREHRLLKTSLPPGVWVRTFEDRTDLLSVMIAGPKNTPYEDAMFFFDFQLHSDYPHAPPVCHYISYCTDRLNPNLYEDGKVCISLLGTWTGRGTEMWHSDSTLLQVIVSIQGLILVAEPYFNEAGYDRQTGTQQGIENSKMYNEMVVVKVIQSTTKLLESPPEMFREHVLIHFKEYGESMHNRILNWLTLSKDEKHSNEKLTDNQLKLPEFPLVPASRGFCIKVEGLLKLFYTKLQQFNEMDLSSNDVND